MRWKKLGLLFNPKYIRSYGLSASLMPIADVLDMDAGIVRVFFSPRDNYGRSQVRFFDYNLKESRILQVSDQALLLPGKLGTFDDSGITLGSMIKNQNATYLYYTGWNRTVTVPMNNSIGIAKLENGRRFMRLGDGPILTRTLEEPYSCASPFVLKDDNRFKMWYASMDRWDNIDGSVRHYYNIKYAESNDGINWIRNNTVAINYQNNEEYAFGRPFVLKENGIFKMWYSFRGDFYKIGYAESDNGIEWNRQDADAGIDTSDYGWDSEMIEYPYIFECIGNRYMLYNGNGYGKSGIGIAIYG